jgi:hypothetical protein
MLRSSFLVLVLVILNNSFACLFGSWITILVTARINACLILHQIIIVLLLVLALAFSCKKIEKETLLLMEMCRVWKVSGGQQKL